MTVMVGGVFKSRKNVKKAAGESQKYDFSAPF
jgi:hypothetical protein